MIGVLEGQKAGRVIELIADVDSKKVKYLLIQDEDAGYMLSLIPVKELVAANEFVTTKTLKSIRKIYEDKEIIGQLENGCNLLDAQVVTDQGEILGAITDFEIDCADGSIQTITLQEGEAIDGASVITMNPKMILVAADGNAARIIEKEEAEKPEELEEDVIETLESILDPAALEMVLGQKLQKTIMNETGDFMIEEGTVITSDLAEEAYKNGVLELVMVNI